MPAVFTGRWTRAQILIQALNRAGNKKITQLARDRLNRRLEELYTQWEWPFLWTEYRFVMPAGNTGGVASYASFQLPADFLKTSDEVTGLLIVTKDGDSSKLPIVERDPVAFRRSANPIDQISDTAKIWYVDYATRFGVVWPAPTAALGCSLTYKMLPPDKDIGAGGPLGAASDATTVAYDADIPLFPYGGYLALDLEAWAREYDHDGQASYTRADAESAFQNIRAVALPRGTVETTVPLDPTVFGPGFRNESDRTDSDWGF